MVEAFATVAQVLDESSVGVYVGVEMPELAEQCALGLGVARVELPHLGGEQVVEEERQRSGGFPTPGLRFKGSGGFLTPGLRCKGGRNAPSPLLGLLAGHKGPTDGLGVTDDPRLDCVMFSGFRHP